jgi:carbonic anhydrase
VLKEMEQKGEIMIVGAMYDIKNGKVAWYSEAPAPAKKI